MGDLEGKLMNTLGLCYDLCTHSPRFSEDDVCSFHQILQEAKLKESSVRRGDRRARAGVTLTRALALTRQRVRAK